MQARLWTAVTAAVCASIFGRACAQPTDVVRSPPQNPAASERYWTKERMERARPVEMGNPSQGPAKKFHTKRKSDRFRIPMR